MKVGLAAQPEAPIRPIGRIAYLYTERRVTLGA